MLFASEQPKPLAERSTAFCMTMQFLPMAMDPPSATRRAPCMMRVPAATVTSPHTVASGATHASGWMSGRFPACSMIMVPSLVRVEKWRLGTAVCSRTGQLKLVPSAAAVDDDLARADGQHIPSADLSALGKPPAARLVRRPDQGTLLRRRDHHYTDQLHVGRRTQLCLCGHRAGPAGRAEQGASLRL